MPLLLHYSRRVRHAWLVLICNVPSQFSIERLELQMALEKLNAAVDSANAAADRLIATASADAAALAQAQSDLAAVDDTAAAAVQPLADKLNASAPAPADPAA